MNKDKKLHGCIYRHLFKKLFLFHFRRDLKPLPAVRILRDDLVWSCICVHVNVENDTEQMNGRKRSFLIIPLSHLKTVTPHTHRHTHYHTVATPWSLMMLSDKITRREKWYPYLLYLLPLSSLLGIFRASCAFLCFDVAVSLLSHLSSLSSLVWTQECPPHTYTLSTTWLSSHPFQFLP